MRSIRTTKFEFRPLDFYGKAVKSLGVGSYGQVKQWRNDIGVTVAIKEFTSTNDGEISHDVLREIAIMKVLDHPNILSIIDVINFDIQSKDKIMVVLPLALADFTVYTAARSVFDPLTVKSFAYQLCVGLLYLHSVGVIHRDIKPANILVLPGNRVVYADFGMARYGAIPGGSYTPHVQTSWWRAPEIILKDGRHHAYTNKIDVFSLGTILIEMFCAVDTLFGAKLITDILKNQIKVLGHFVEQDWPGISDTNAYSVEIAKFAAVNNTGTLNGIFRLLKNGAVMSDQLKELLTAMTYPNPSIRWSMAKVIEHEWFQDSRPVNYKYIEPTCGSNYRLQPIVAAPTPSALTMKQRRALYLVGWTMCKSSNFDEATRFHFRFVFDSFMAINGDINPITNTPFNYETLVCLVAIAVFIATQIFEKHIISIDEVSQFLISMKLNPPDLVLYQRLMLKTLDFDVAFNTYIEYRHSLLNDQQIKEEIVDAADNIAQFMYVVYLEPINAQTLAALALGVACRSYAIELPTCIRADQQLEAEIDQFGNSLRQLLALLANPEYQRLELFRSFYNYFYSKRKLDHVYAHFLNPMALPKPIVAELDRGSPSSPSKTVGDITFYAVLKILKIYDSGKAIDPTTLVATLERGEIVSFVRATLQTLAIELVNETDPKEIDEITAMNYFHGAIDGNNKLKWTTKETSNIQVIFGVLAAEMTVKLIFQNIPVGADRVVNELMFDVQRVKRDPKLFGRLQGTLSIE